MSCIKPQGSSNLAKALLNIYRGIIMKKGKNSEQDASG